MRLTLCLQKVCPSSMSIFPRRRPFGLVPLLRSQQWKPQRCFMTGRKPQKEDPSEESDKTSFKGSETSESKLFAMGSSLATRMSADRKFQCTEFDETGSVVTGHGNIQRSELVSKYGIQPRDLRKIDQSQLPAILVRQSTILVNILHYRVLITDKHVLVLHVISLSEAHHISAFMYGLEGKLKYGNTVHDKLPYELRALETILVMVMSELDAEFQELRKPVLQVLEELDHDVSLEKLKKLLDVSKQLSAFQQKVKLVREALHMLLDADDDMAAMYLSAKASGKPRAEADHEEAELLLENYYECGGEIGEKANNLLSDVEITHDSVKSVLDSHRNSIMMLEVHFSVAMLSIATGTYVAGLYGMNVFNGLEEAAQGFFLVSGGSALGIFGVGLFGLHMVRRVKRFQHLYNFRPKLKQETPSKA